jgi:bifunctional DNA-binding transcriptional regulator/antitoxin component of YhaV-PrlF toxin-antitoxin module
MTPITVQIRKKGNLTLPVELRNKYSLDEGDTLTLVDLGDGSFLLTPRVLQVNRLADRVAEKLYEANVSLDDLLNTLDDEREQYYREHYAKE